MREIMKPKQRCDECDIKRNIKKEFIIVIGVEIDDHLPSNIEMWLITG